MAPAWRLVATTSTAEAAVLLLLAAATTSQAALPAIRPPPAAAAAVAAATATVNATTFPSDRQADDGPDADDDPEPITDKQVLRFRNRFADLGVSFDQLMAASQAGTLDAYNADINNGREELLHVSRAVRRYRSILTSLHAAGRCVDFVRQATPDEPDTCGVERWRRCCRGTTDDRDGVLLCAAHKNLGVSPPFRTADGRAANSFRIRALPLRRVVRSQTGGVPAGAARWSHPDAPWRPPAGGAASPPPAPWSVVDAVGRWAAAVGGGRRGGGGTAARRRGRAAAAAPAEVAVEGLPRPTVATASRTAAGGEVPFYFEEQYEEIGLVVDDPFVAWCKEFLFYSAGCVEFCCSTLFAGSALCDVNASPDFCF